MILIYYSGDKKKAIFWGLMLLWNRGLLGALTYPIHPTTWAILPLTLLCISLKEKREKLFWISFISLLFFKEIFCLATLILGIAFLIKKVYRKGLIVLCISAFMILFNFKWRAILLDGEGFPHGPSLLTPFLENFFEASIELLKRFSFTDYIKTLGVSFISIIALMIKRPFERSDFFILSLWLPLLFMHTIYGTVGFQYGAILSFPPLLVLWKNTTLLTNKKFQISLIVLTLLTGSSIHTRTFRYLLKKRNHCELSSEKQISIKKVRNIIFNRPIKEKILATGGSIPSILRPKAMISHIKAPYTTKFSNYDLLLIGTKENYWPLKKENIAHILDICQRNNTSQIIFSDKYHLLIEGPISEDCLGLLQ